MAEEEFKRFEFQFGLVMFRTRRFQALMDSLGRHRFSRQGAWVLLYLMPVAAAVGLYLFVPQLIVLFSPTNAQVGTVIRSYSPLVYLGLPGINPYLPIVDGWLALIVAMIVHEGAHGVVARSLGLPVKSAGLLFLLVLPIGAFVEVDEKALKVAKARDSGRVLAAGAGVNLVIGVLALLLLFGMVSTMTPRASGLAISQVVVGSPAANAGVKPGDFITSINGVSYSDPSVVVAMEANGTLRPGEAINITLWSGGTTTEIDGVTLAPHPDNATLAFLGVQDVGSADLQSLVTSYTGSFWSRPIYYLCIPTLPICPQVPFSPSVSAFYQSPFGNLLDPLANLLYWFFFLNFNLAVFNSLPLYPLDGGQAFNVGVKALGGDRLSEKGATAITALASLAVLAMIMALPLAAYLHLI